MYDAYTGAIRATYRPYNAMDEMESPTVVMFSNDGQRLVCGGFRSDRVLHVFDLAVPGRDSTTLRLGKTRRSTDGQKGLVSALACAPDARYFGVGTFAPGSIYIYDDRAAHFSNQTVLNGLCVVGHGRGHARKKRRLAQDHDDNAMEGDQFIRHAKAKWFQGRVQGGVTQLKFAPDKEYSLYSASRRSDSILTWDLRMLSDNQDATPVRGIGSFPAALNTNQRLEFDLSDDGSMLFVGGVDQCVRIYDTQSGKLVDKIDQLDDTTNGVSFTRLSNHTSYLAVATGSRRFPQDNDDGSEEDEHQGEDSRAPGYLRLYKLAQKDQQVSKPTLL